MNRRRSCFKPLSRGEADRIARDFKRKYPNGCEREEDLLVFLRNTAVIWKPIAKLFRRNAVFAVRAYGCTRLNPPMPCGPSMTAFTAARWLRDNGMIKPLSRHRSKFQHYGRLGAFGVEIAFLERAIDLGRDREAMDGVATYLRETGLSGTALERALDTAVQL